MEAAPPSGVRTSPPQAWLRRRADHYLVEITQGGAVRATATSPRSVEALELACFAFELWSLSND